MKPSVRSGKPIKIRGALGAAASIVCGVLAACGQSESNPGGQTESGGTSATSGGRGGRGGGSGVATTGGHSAGRGGSSGGSNSTTGGAPSIQGGEPGEAGAAGDPTSGAGGSAGGAPDETGGTPNDTGGNAGTGGRVGAGGSTGGGAAAQSGAAGEDAGDGGAAGSSSLVPVGKAGFAACGSLECPLEEFEKACCWNHDSNTSECDSPEQSCTFGQAVHVLHCDEAADCPASNADEPTGCTFDWRNGGGRAECSAPLLSPQLEAAMVIVQLCNPGAPDDDCGSGTCRPVTEQALLSGLLPANFHACY
jgi:hypothetical protein